MIPASASAKSRRGRQPRRAFTLKWESTESCPPACRWSVPMARSGISSARYGHGSNSRSEWISKLDRSENCWRGYEPSRRTGKSSE